MARDRRKKRLNKNATKRIVIEKKGNQMSSRHDEGTLKIEKEKEVDKER